jgi:hypothetical protein
MYQKRLFEHQTQNFKRQFRFPVRRRRAFCACRRGNVFSIPRHGFCAGNIGGNEYRMFIFHI